MPLTQRQTRFVEEYARDQNATQAAIRAGYTEASALTMGSYLSQRHPEVSALIRGQQQIAVQASGLTRERVLREIASIALHDTRALFNADGSLKRPHEWDDATAAALAGLEVSRTQTSIDGQVRTEESVLKVKRWDKARMLELLAKHFSIGTDRSTESSSVLDAAALAQMSDAEIEQAARAYERLRAVVQSTGTE